MSLVEGVWARIAAAARMWVWHDRGEKEKPLVMKKLSLGCIHIRIGNVTRDGDCQDTERCPSTSGEKKKKKQQKKERRGRELKTRKVKIEIQATTERAELKMRDDS